MKIWITKYWETDGIYATEAEIANGRAKVEGINLSYSPKEWAICYDEAVLQVQSKIDAKRKSIAKKLAALDDYDFSDRTGKRK